MGYEHCIRPKLIANVDQAAPGFIIASAMLAGYFADRVSFKVDGLCH